MTTNNSIIFRAEYQEMLDGLRKIEPAWGCGVFEWNPETVAELFMEVKGRYNYIRRSWVI